MEKIFKAGIDIGSTTAKMVVYDNNDNMIFKTKFAGRNLRACRLQVLYG